MPALQVRRDYDVYDAEDYACGEQDEFDGHTRQYTLNRVDVRYVPIVLQKSFYLTDHKFSGP